MSSRMFRTVSFLALLLAGTAFTLAFLSRYGQMISQPRPAAQSSATAPAAAVTAPQALPPGTIAYTAAGNTSALAIARLHLAQSSFMTAPELETAIRKANDGKAVFKKGQTVFVPGIEPQPVVEKSRPFPKDGEVRAIYLTGSTAGSVRGLELVRRWHQSGGNAVVFDIKDSDGTINVPFNHPLSRKLTHYPITNLPKYVRYLHSLDMHIIARQALFRDDNIARNHGTLAVQSRRTHAPWLENGKLVWSDPSRKEVQDYNIALAKYIAQSGVDEIQFDYVRFPAEGDQKDAEFVFQSDPKMHRDDVIANFLGRAYTELHSMGVLLSLDVFGIMAWQRQVDLNHTGQDIVKMAQHCDVISPMIYPSHFFGMDGYAHPGDEPEHFISTSMERFQKVTAGSGVTLRPWLQAFAWRTRTYSSQYILTQVGASRQHGGNGFLFWNAGNDYSKPFVAMQVIMANPKQYLLPPHKTAVAGSGAVNGLTGTHL
ncbi:MAG TPA: putative glycoside hydrolase [Candidatus Angelobacter sp.]|nr:putative glycoside hydrolase [Candidatus Angelobacter sp.]